MNTNDEILKVPEPGPRNPKLETSPPSEFEPVTAERRLTGKVARLPPEIRILVNQMLDTGKTYKAIVAKLAELGHAGFFEQNIQRWKDAGYQRWVRLQERCLEARLEAEAAAELANDPKNIQNLVEANEIKLALRNSRLLDEIHDWDAETVLVKNPTAFFRLSRSVTQQLAERTRRERFKFQVAQQTKPDVRPITKETFDGFQQFLTGHPAETSAEVERVAPRPPSQLETQNSKPETSLIFEAETRENTVENLEPPPVAQPETRNATPETIAYESVPSPGGEGQGEGGFFSSSASDSSMECVTQLENQSSKPEPETISNSLPGVSNHRVNGQSKIVNSPVGLLAITPPHQEKDHLVCTTPKSVPPSHEDPRTQTHLPVIRNAIVTAASSICHLATVEPISPKNIQTLQNANSCGTAANEERFSERSRAP